MSGEPLTLDERERAAELFEELFGALSAIGREPDGDATTRLSWTPEAEDAARWFDAAARRLGLEPRVDRNGNRWAGPDGPALVITGSHLDTVPHGGSFDGALGVVAGLIAVHLVNARGATQRPLAVVAFADEEGGRFNTPTFGSRLMTGALDPHDVIDRLDDAGVRLGDALDAAGVRPQELGRDDAALERIEAFVELHVEQGDELGQLDRPLGIAVTIKPHGRWRVDLVGQANHGGTTAMASRRDPMLALAELLVATRRVAIDAGALATVGKLEVWPNASNSVPGRVSAWLDVRSDEEGALARVVDRVIDAVTAVAGAAGIEVAVSHESSTPGVEFSESLRDRIETTLAEFDLEPVPLDTGAGHDAGALAARSQPRCCSCAARAGSAIHRPRPAVRGLHHGYRRPDRRARRPRGSGRGRNGRSSGQRRRMTGTGQHEPVTLGFQAATARDVVRVARA